MKKKILRVCLMLVILCGGILLTNGSVQAKTQNYYTKGKTLVVTGQLRNGTHIKNAKKIKKIVVKDNIKILPTKPTLPYNVIIDKINSGEIKALWIVATNPIVSWINNLDFKKAAEKLDGEIHGHQVYFYGLCEKCLKEAKNLG